MTEEVTQGPMAVDPEEGEILEDGEIADDEDDIVAIGQSSPGQSTATKDEKENKESNKSKFAAVGSFSSYYPMDREEHFKPHKRKKKNNSKKRKRSNSNDAKRKQQADPVINHNLEDISHCINDSTFDTVELSDQDEYNLEVLSFDVLMEILGCTVAKDLLNSISAAEKQKYMLRIMKIMKQLHGNDADTSRRFARLKRRTKEGQTVKNNPGPKTVFKAICKFYLEGKCHKGAECYFSHDCVVPKRKELCKFYLQGFCGKGDDCLFMHGEFPCKFFHTNTECYSGDNCRFSHAPLTEDTREILRNYLDSGTLPDDPKPVFRSHYSDWPSTTNNNPVNNNNMSNKNNFDPNEMDTPEFDSSFNYETEQLLSKPRPVILGEPTSKMKASYETWMWQQELKELEKAYTGLKKNLFCIDEIFAITEKPPTPRIEDDEDEVEAQIMNYYNDMLDTDEMDEMVALQEIEEHQRKVQEEEAAQALKAKESPADTQPPNAAEELSEEEKRLIEASAHDEDLRILPGNAFHNPPAINPVFDQVSFVPNNNYFPMNDNYGQPNPFNLPDNTNGLPMETKPPMESGYSDLGTPFGSQAAELTSVDVSNMVRQIRNGSVSEPAPPTAPVAPPSKPEYRDPRLNRLKDSSRAQSAPIGPLQSSPTHLVEEKAIVNKPFIKVCNPNVIIDYKMVPICISCINYATYYDLYLTDNSLKNDPRLKKFFTTNSGDQKTAPNDLDYGFSRTKNDTDNLMTLPPVALPSSKLGSIISAPVPSQVISPLEVISAKVKIESETSTSHSLNRDPRIRAKEVERRRTSDSKLEEGSKSTVTEEKPAAIESSPTADDPSPVTSSELPNGHGTDLESGASSTSPTADTQSSIPSYAMAAYASTRSLYSAASNSLFANLTSSDNLSNGASLNTSESGNFGTAGQDNVADVDSQDSDNDKLEVAEDDDDDDETGTLKVDMDDPPKDEVPTPDNTTDTEPILSAWPKINSNIESHQPSGSIDSDNEMEIDLNHHNESEVDSENENDLIIASSSEPEDNKDCETANNSDSVAVQSDYSVNC